VQGRDPIRLQTGDLVLVPRGDSHAVSDKDGSPLVQLDELIAALQRRSSAEDIHTRLLCGGFALNDRLTASVASLLPDVIRVDAATVAGTIWLQPVLAALEAEVANGLPGAQAIRAKMADVLLAQVLRSWLIGADRAGLRMNGLLADSPVARALEALRDRYAEQWTIDRLAAHVALSRTALAARFRQHVGDSPMHYLTRIRVGQAAGYLATTRLSLSEIAHLT
jgi:AraC-like DNA-binding protein